MTKVSKSGLRLDSDYTEDVVGFALESFLAVISFPRHRFTIEPFSRSKERWLGADARLHSEIRGFRPFYMQFKRPSAYPDFSSAGIIRDRKRLKLQTSPRALYFDLRKKQDHHREFQHNILFRLHKHLHARQIGDAAYVCPLFLERSAYRFHLHQSAQALWLKFWRRYPWDIEELLLSDGGETFQFERVPVFAEHITVPPHTTVTSASHRYSFTETGSDLCFHSPEALPEGSASLGKFLGNISRGFVDEGESIRPEEADGALKELIDATGAVELSESGFSEAFERPLERWFAWGEHLRTNHDIHQYALVSWED